MNEASKKVLIIDDEQDILDVLKLILGKEEYEVFTALNGEAAVEITRNNNIDLVLCDLNLGEESGLSILKSLKTIRPDIYFIVITGFGSIETAVEAMKVGAFDFIEKPIRRHNILKVVEKAFENLYLIKENKALKQKLEEKSSVDKTKEEDHDSINVKIGNSMDDIEYKIIKKTLEFTKGNKEIAAQILGLGINTLIRKISDKENPPK
jgi:DNA-binding NtrC family response regulator